MIWLRRLLGLIVLLVALVVLAGCVAGGVGIWPARQRAAEKVEDISQRLDRGLKRVESVNQRIKDALQRARADLAQVNKRSAELDGSTAKKRMTTVMLRQMLEQKIGPNVNQVSGRLNTLTDAAVVLASLLQSLEELPAGHKSVLSPDKLSRLAEVAAQLPGPLQKLQALLGDPDAAPEQGDVSAAANEVDLVLQRCQAIMDDWESNLQTATVEFHRIRDDIPTWLTRIAIAVTVVCAWVGLSQISLMAHAWKWCRRK
jgi:hypothetical protein